MAVGISAGADKFETSAVTAQFNELRASETADALLPACCTRCPCLNIAPLYPAQSKREMLSIHLGLPAGRKLGEMSGGSRWESRESRECNLRVLPSEPSGRELYNM